MSEHDDIARLRAAAQQPLEPIHFTGPVNMVAMAERVMTTLQADSAKPNRVDLAAMEIRLRKAYKERGANCLGRLPQRDLRHLPWTLVQGAEDARPIAWPGLLHVAIREMKSTERISRLTGWIRVYLQNYEDSAEFNELRTAIAEKLSAYEGKNPRLTVWKDRLPLVFTNDAAERCSKGLLLYDGTPASYLVSLGLVEEMADGGFVNAVALRVVDETALDLHWGLEQALKLLEVDGGGGVTFRSRDIAEHAVSKLIPAAGGEADEDIREPLKSFALRYFRDPRLPGNRANWSKIDESAKDILARWISHADVEFFFSLVEQAARDKHWKYRKRFWEGYVDHFQSTWVALGPRAKRLARQASNGRHASERAFGSLRDAVEGQSVFIIQMGGYDFVEWSNSGACRVWPQDKSPIVMGRKTYSGSDLRSENFAHRQIHNGADRYGWQRELATWIQRNTGLKATNSYRL